MKRLVMLLLSVTALMGLVVVPAFAGVNDKLVVKDSGGINSAFVVTNQINNAAEGTVGVGIAPKSALHVEATVRPQFIVSNGTVDLSGLANARMDFLRGNSLSVSQLLFGTGAAPTQVLDWQMGMFNDSVFQLRVVNQPGKGIALAPTTGYVGIGTTAPLHPLQVCGAGGCSYNDGGTTWVNASSREYKENIKELSSSVAMDTLKNLNPVTYTYKTVPEQGHVGFIAEDVPEIVAMKDRKGLSALDIVAVLTKVVQEQNKTIEALSAKIEKIEKAAQTK